MKDNEIFPYLVIEKKQRHNDFIFLDICSLDIFASFEKDKLNYQSLDVLDSLTLQFSAEEIKKSILRANVVANQEDVYDGQLLIKINKHRLPVMTRDVVEELNLPKLFGEIFGDESKKRYLNMIYNKLSSIVKNKDLLINIKKCIDENDSKEFYALFAKLSYQEQRELYFYIYREMLSKYNNSLKRKRESNNE